VKKIKAVAAKHKKEKQDALNKSLDKDRLKKKLLKQRNKPLSHPWTKK
jgi:hypothetical protein